jgi:hypothetical protein
MGFVLVSDIATMRLRGARQGLITISNAIWGLIMQFTIPYMVSCDIALTTSNLLIHVQINPDAGNLGGKVSFIFFATGIVAAIGGWILHPETKVLLRLPLSSLSY